MISPYAYGDSPVTNHLHMFVVAYGDLSQGILMCRNLHMGIPVDPRLHMGIYR